MGWGSVMKRFLALALVFTLLLPSVLAEAPEGDLAEEEVVIVTSEGRALQYKDRGEDVLSLQTRLKDLYYYTGPLSGEFMELTQKAVRQVQEAYGLEATGVADLKTQDIIYGDAHRPLKRGSEGQDVARMQTRLSELGYYWGKISGNYLDGSTAAIGNFQEDNGLEKTGKADIATLIKLYSDDIVMPTPDPVATPAPIPTLPPGITYPGTLAYGAKNDHVKMAQERLTALGFFDRKLTGGYYEHTHKAVKDFQKHNGLRADGVIGEETWNMLFSLDAVHLDATPRPTPAPTPVAYSIDVDVTNQLIKVFSRDAQGQFTRIDRVFTCSTGTTGYPSEAGTFTLKGRKAKWAEFPNWGGGKARWWVQINADIAFHSVIYDSNNLNDVNMRSVNKLGSRASHGCIRLTVADAKWIYDNIGAGVTVRIYEDGPPDPELKAANKPGSFNKSTYLHNPTPAPTPAPLYDGARPPAGDVRALSSGSEGADVFWLQSKLRELGFYKGTVTGTYLDGTKAAVKAFQKANKLSQTGKADKATLQFLYDLATANTTPSPTPLPTDPPDAESSGQLLPGQTPLPAEFTVEGEGD